MTINNRGLSGQPTLPYVDFRSYAGADVFIDLAFLDHTGCPSIPSSLVYQVDDLTNAVNVIPSTSVAITGSTQTLQIPGAKLNLTHYWQGSEVFQIWMTAVLQDGSTVQSVSVLELLAIQTPFGTNQF
jgi:hypothetical protein